MKRTLQLLSLVALLCVPWLTKAQETLTVADGTTTNGNVPVYGYWADAAQHNQIVYPDDLLSDLSGSTISGMTFYGSASPSWGITATVSLAVVDETSLSALIESADLQQVWSGEVTFTDNSWEIILDEEFSYGGGNLLVDIVTTSGSYASCNFYGISSTGGSWRTYNSSGAKQDFLPKVTFAYTAAQVGGCPKPGAVTVSGLSAHTATLSWVTNGASEWVLSLGDESITVYDSIYTFEGLDAETTYQVSVVAACGGETSEARTKTFTTTIACPVPTGLAATLTPGNGSVATLGWTESGIATEWQICLNDDEQNLITTTTNPFYLTGLTPEQTYTAKVRAVCGGEDGSSQWSSAITFTPTNAYSLTVNDGTNTNGYIPIYGFYVDGNIVSQFIFPADGLTPLVSGTINKLTFYCSSATSNWGNAQFEVYMSEVDYTTFSSTALVDWSTMTKVVTARVLSISDGLMEVALDEPFPYMGGNLMVGFKETVSGGYSQSPWYGITATGASLGGDNNGNQQNFLPKTTFNYTPGDGTPCLRVSNLAVDSVGTDYALLSWTPGQEDENLWLVMLNDEVIATTTSNTYYITNLEPNTNYTVSVATLCEDGDTSDWRTVQFITEAACSALVYSLEAGSIGGDYAIINWWVDSTVEAYSVYLNGELMGTSTTGAFTFTGLEGLTTYTASVMAMCGTETGVASSVEFTTEMYCSAGSCEVTIVGSDSFGDGWNGNAINVLMNGNLVGTFSPTSGGKDAPIVESYTVCKGAPVSFSWISGSYSSETSFTIKDGVDMEVYSGSDAQSSTFFTLENACPSCMPVSDCQQRCPELEYRGQQRYGDGCNQWRHYCGRRHDVFLRQPC